MSSKGAARFLVTALPLCCGACQPGQPNSLMRSPEVVNGLHFAVTPDQRLGSSTVDFAWSGGERARSFLIQVGSSAGASDVAEFDSRTPQPSFRWTAAPVGTFYVRVRGRNEFGTAGPSEEVRIDSVDPRHVIEALFLGSGPLASRREAPCDRRDLPSWPLDTPVVFRVGRDVPAAMTHVLEALRSQVPGATRGALWLTIVHETQPDLRPRPGELTLSLTDDLSGEPGCPAGTAGCAIETVSGPALESVRLLVRRKHRGDGRLLAREVAHSVLGLHHVAAPVGLRPRPVLDAAWPSSGSAEVEGAASWDATTVRAVKAVYAAGLSAGASRQRFLAAGLIEPSGPLTPSDELRKTPAGRIRVARPLCGSAGSGGGPEGRAEGAPPSVP